MVKNPFHDCGVALYPPTLGGGFTATEDKKIPIWGFFGSSFFDFEMYP
ncbi:hypothetical protein [Moraxella lacunata]